MPKALEKLANERKKGAELQRLEPPTKEQKGMALGMALQALQATRLGPL